MKDVCTPSKVAERIIKFFPRTHNHTDPLRILLCTILSQRTRDENTERACENLFQRFKTLDEIANADPKEIEPLIVAAGIYRQKAVRIVEVSRTIKNKYAGQVPSTLEELLQLPGVGRKTANIVLAVAYGIPAIAVDTHVHRISNRLGWVKTEKPDATEEALKKIIPLKLWKDLNGSMVEFGRTICRPQNPKCDQCPISLCCEYHRARSIT
ncbi:MAG: endonuclease III [Thermotogae bacterium]|nr:endonuclease III [Thermotogota bacterium]